MRVDAENVVVTTVKRSDYSNGFIIRLFDAEGVPNPEVKIRFAVPPKSVKKVNLLEDPIEDVEQTAGTIRFPLHKWEIATLLAEY